jgi:hypothetical protein
MVFRHAVLGPGQANSLGFIPPNAATLFDPVANYLALRNGRLSLDNSVISIAPTPGESGLTALTQEGTKVKADCIVIAVPYWGVAGLLRPAWRELPYFSNLAALPSHPIVDVFLDFDRPIFYEEAIAIPGLPAVWMFPEQLQDNRQRLAISISCPGDLAKQSAEDIVKWTQERLTQTLGPLPGQLLDCHVRKHMRATFSTSPEHQRLRPACSSPAPRLFLAGDYTATGWPATMEGAVRSGVTAAKAAMAFLDC